MTRAFQAQEAHRHSGGLSAKNLTAIDVEDCQTRQPIKMDQQVLKILRWRLYYQHALYACVP